jgi:hypothetical protein
MTELQTIKRILALIVVLQVLLLAWDVIKELEITTDLRKRCDSLYENSWILKSNVDLDKQEIQLVRAMLRPLWNAHPELHLKGGDIDEDRAFPHADLTLDSPCDGRSR